MKTSKESILWAILPYGGETQPEDSNANSGENPTNVVASQGNSTPTGVNTTASSDDDEDDPYAGLSAKELRRIQKIPKVQRAETRTGKADLEKLN